MRATLNIPDDLMKKVQKISGETSKTKAITTAMREYIRKEKMKKLISLRGNIQIDYDWKKEEEIELKAQRKREKLLERKD
jgi:metal-responsive CopG/Arc/MetJ family transcriptional regulator